MASPSPAPAGPARPCGVRAGSPRKPTSKTRGEVVRRGCRRTRRARRTSAVPSAHRRIRRARRRCRPAWVCRIALATRLVSARFSSRPLPATAARSRRPSRSAARPAPRPAARARRRSRRRGRRGRSARLSRRQRAGLDPGQVEQVLDHLVEPVDRRADLLVVQLRVVDDAVLERLGHRAQPGQRRAQVVADPGHQLAPGRLQGPLPLAGGGQRGGGRAQLAADLRRPRRSAGGRRRSGTRPVADLGDGVPQGLRCRGASRRPAAAAATAATPPASAVSTITVFQSDHRQRASSASRPHSAPVDAAVPVSDERDEQRRRERRRSGSSTKPHRRAPATAAHSSAGRATIGCTGVGFTRHGSSSR